MNYLYFSKIILHSLSVVQFMQRKFKIYYFVKYASRKAIGYKSKCFIQNSKFHSRKLVKYLFFLRSLYWQVTNFTNLLFQAQILINILQFQHKTNFLVRNFLCLQRIIEIKLIRINYSNFFPKNNQKFIRSLNIQISSLSQSFLFFKLFLLNLRFLADIARTKISALKIRKNNYQKSQIHRSYIFSGNIKESKKQNQLNFHSLKFQFILKLLPSANILFYQTDYNQYLYFQSSICCIFKLNDD